MFPDDHRDKLDLSSTSSSSGRAPKGSTRGEVKTYCIRAIWGRSIGFGRICRRPDLSRRRSVELNYIRVNCCNSINRRIHLLQYFGSAAATADVRTVIAAEKRMDAFMVAIKGATRN